MWVIVATKVFSLGCLFGFESGLVERAEGSVAPELDVGVVLGGTVVGRGSDDESAEGGMSFAGWTEECVVVVRGRYGSRRVEVGIADSLPRLFRCA